VLGSGALKIGEAGEFDYSGSQAIKALKEEGVEVVLVNPNIATVQTDKGLADHIYLLPVTPEFVTRVIKKERPDAILLAFGGQTALNCGVQLAEQGVLKRLKVQVLGTPVRTIQSTEDRELFRKKLGSMGIPFPQGKTISNAKEGLRFAKKIGYPLFIRVGYALGGKGSGIAKTKRDLAKLLNLAFAITKEVLIEKYLEGWKEVEYEMMRDRVGNCIAICNMENVDPMGVHTGESIVVAPSQTLTNEQYHSLRQVSKQVTNALGIIGECNVQLALSPTSNEYRMIEVNARLSRSSALASKATGYPIAFIAAKLGLGYTLDQLENKITGKTKAFFEPALDYIVTKIPRWDLEKFPQVDTAIGTEMKSVGEVMAIGRTFEESLQKAIRMLQKGFHGVVGEDLFGKNLKPYLNTPHELRILAIAEALSRGWDIKRIHQLTNIDPWFLQKIAHITRLQKELKRRRLKKELLLKAKKAGFSDWQIGRVIGKKELEVRALRKKWRIFPVVKQIDTMAAEWPAYTNYLYFTYNGEWHDVAPSKKKSIIILGSGTYRIGSSVEFDWCCVNALRTAKHLNYETIMVNYNPETVSTDFDECDKLYFEELSLERIMDIYEFERSQGMVVSMGGQIPNNIAYKCHELQMKILGTNPRSIDRAENRSKFSQLLDKLGILQPPWQELGSIHEAKKFAKKVGYPVLIRPSYVLSGQDMTVIFTEQELQGSLKKNSRISYEYPVVISKFLLNAQEIELDAVAQRGKIITSIVSEHIEPAGTHSGDSFIVTPPQRSYAATMRRVQEISEKITKALEITGPLNVQFLAKDNEVWVIECNLRCSRSFPFVSKVHQINLAELATKAILNVPLTPHTNGAKRYVGVKAPQFSFSRLRGADPLASVDMSSTGEVGCLGNDIEEAFLKSLLSVGIQPPQKHVLVSIGGGKQKYELLDAIRTLWNMKFTLYGTTDTAIFFQEKGIPMKVLHKIQEKAEPNVLTYLKERKIDFLISIPREDQSPKSKTSYLIRRAAVDHNIPLLTNTRTVRLLVRALRKYPKIEDLGIQEWHEYMKA